MPTEVVLTITGVRKPGLDESSLHEYLSTYHAPLALPFLLKYGIKEYTLIDQFSAFAPHAEQMQMTGKLADCHYIVQFVMDDIGQFKKLWEDEEFNRTVKPDHVNFANENKSGSVLLSHISKAKMC
ncbi:EthD domain-containing protein [Aspergillus spinulosporus]